MAVTGNGRGRRWTWAQYVTGAEARAALVADDHSDLRPAEFSAFLAAQPDLSPKCWPRYVSITSDLPTTATHKTLKRALVAQGPVAGDGVLWIRDARGNDVPRGDRLGAKLTRGIAGYTPMNPATRSR